MKLSPAQKNTPLKANQSQLLQKWADEPLTGTPYYMLLALIADVLDTALVKGDTYMILGTTKDKTALTITVVQGSDRGHVYAVDLNELAAGAESLL